MNVIGAALGSGLRTASATSSVLGGAMRGATALETGAVNTARGTMTAARSAANTMAGSKPLQAAAAATAVVGAMSTSSESAMATATETVSLPVEENVFVDDTGDHQVLLAPSRDMPIETIDGDLMRFLATPTIISQQQWDVGGAISQFNPWALWYANAAVKRRLANYALLSCKLKLRIVTNGNAYQYGKLIFGYLPAPARDPFRSHVSGLVGFAVDRLPLQWSIDPSKDSVIDLEVPWTYPSESSLVTNHIDLSNIGVFTPLVAAPLATTSTGILSPYVDITVFASVVDVKLQHRTTAFPTMQSEYKGVMSKPLATAASIASKFKDVPIIGQYADVFNKTASIGAGLTSAFGFSRPAYAENDVKVIVRPMGNLTSGDANDTSTSLTLDPRATTIIDPALAGSEQLDSMALAYWFKRESLVGSYDWTTAQAVGTNIASIDNGPHYTTQTDPWSPSYLSYATIPFRARRGGIKYRFVLPCTAFHTGRLQFIYEPFNTIIGDPTNVVQNVVMDLAHDREVVMDIPYVYKYNWFVVDNRSSSTALKGDYIGRIHVRVLSQLRAGGVDSTLKLLVYISGGDDYEVNQFRTADLRSGSTALSFFPVNTLLGEPAGVPIGGYYPYTYTPPGFAEEIEAEPNMQEGIEGDVHEQTIVGDTQPVTSMFSQMHYSERILSFRELIKRYVLYQQFTLTSPGNTSVWSESRLVRNMPPPSMYIHTSVGTRLFGERAWTMLAWMNAAHLGWKGSVRHKFYTYDTANTLIAAKYIGNPLEQQYSNFSTIQNMPVWTYNTDGGCEVGRPQPNQVVEVQIPYNFDAAYSYCGLIDPYVSEGTRSCVQLTKQGNSQAWVAHHIAAGDDLTYFMCVGPPVLHTVVLG